MPQQNTSLRSGLYLALGCALAYGCWGAVEIWMAASAHLDAARLLGSFACFGFLVGGILAFDEYPRKRSKGRPWARTAFGLIAGLGITLIWPWPLEGQLLSMAVGSGLGYFGMLWAQWM